LPFDVARSSKGPIMVNFNGNETRVLDTRLKLLEFHMPCLSFCLYMSNKDMTKIEKGGLLHGSGHAVGRGWVSTQLIFSHLPGTEMRFSFK
jgi:hypothetical protein